MQPFGKQPIVNGNVRVVWSHVHEGGPLLHAQVLLSAGRHSDAARMAPALAAAEAQQPGLLEVRCTDAALRGSHSGWDWA